MISIIEKLLIPRIEERDFSISKYNQIKLTNWVSFICSLFAFIFLIYVVTLKLYFSSLVAFIVGAVYFSIIILNYYHFYKASKYVHTLNACVSIYFFSCHLGYASGVHLFILLSPVFVLSVFSLEEVKSIIITISCYIITYLCCIIFVSPPFIQKIMISPLLTTIFYSMNIFFIMILTIFQIAYLLRLNNRNINEMINSNIQLVERKKLLEKEIIKQKESEENIKKLFDDLSDSYKSLEQFSYIVSHNLRGPVANLIGLSEIFDKKNIDSKSNLEVIDHISTSTIQLDSVIKDLNNILSVNKRNINEKNELIDLELEMDKIKLVLKNQIDKLDADLTYDFGECQEIYTIKSFIYSIFYNLTSNSLKYSMPGIRPVIVIKGKLIDGQLSISFSDNGLGIDLNKNKEKIFKLYSRFHRNIDGKGLGLYLVKSQIQLLGGRVEVQSKPNEGSIFTLYLKQEDENAENNHVG